ncbi:porin family protein [Thalassotalea sp. G20_0]|uniref:outer membrane beta-barrel protein n=1 Tax=Thalassotalea sp. G20_0 TaxID=2821093 RepID=UPI001AD99D27|nr:outer membrane beta-barrel protein [Thalassotalea sp. G20_0]MBO9494804.1 porin family protein [Thalassotalea sp. G20_0]
MKKITSLLSALAFSAVSSFALATGWDDGWSENDIFVGLEGGYAKTKVKLDGSGASVDDSDNTGFFGLRLGGFMDDEARVYFTAGYLKPKDAQWGSDGVDFKVHDIKQLNLLVSADYLFMPEWDVQPFIGLTIGATETKANGSFIAADKQDSFKKKWGFAYGAQAGVIYQIDNIDLEAGVKYLTNGTSHQFQGPDDIKLKVNDSCQAYVAASIHF